MSKRLHVEVPHSLSQAEALERLRALGDYFVNRHGMNMRWESETVGHLAGRYLLIHIEGRFSIEQTRVQLDGKDPGVLLRRKAIDYLTRKISTYLNPATPIDQLPTR